jgi:Ala-tRNA(Pro) deacylase
MQCLQRLEAYLREQKVPFQIQHHPLAYTAREVAATEHLPTYLMAKVVVVFADGRPVMLVVPASLHVSLDQAGKAIGAAVARLAHEEELATLFPDCAIGAMPPFGNLYDLPVYVDRTLAQDEHMVFQAGTHADTMRMAYADFARLVQPAVAEFAFPRPALTTAVGARASAPA